MQKGLYGVLGVTSGEALDTFSVNPPAIAHQEMGALIALVALTLWVGRGHLKDVCLQGVFSMLRMSMTPTRFFPTASRGLWRAGQLGFCRGLALSERHAAAGRPCSFCSVPLPFSWP